MIADASNNPVIQSKIGGSRSQLFRKVKTHEKKINFSFQAHTVYFFSLFFHFFTVLRHPTPLAPDNSFQKNE
jgi:hypothetical protein